MVLKGAAVSRSIMERLAVKSQELREKRVFPKLAIVRAGERPDDLSYEKSVLKKNKLMLIFLVHICKIMMQVEHQPLELE